MKTINKIKWLLTFSVAMILTIGCDDLLDVEPESAIGESQFWLTEADANAGVAAIYDAMQEAYSRKYFLWGELRSDNFTASPSAENPEAIEISNNTLNDQRASYGGWGDMYKMILNANLAINNLQDSPVNVPQLLGEAHALRAFVYFDMVRAYGSVPLYLDAITGINDNIFRSKTAGSIILDSLVIPDMLRAEELITAPTSRFQFSQASVYCLQAEVYMHKHDYVKAKEALDNLEALAQLGNYRLVRTSDDFHSLFRKEPDRFPVTIPQEEGPELIFSLKYDVLEDQGQGSAAAFFWPGVRSYVLSPELENKWIETFPIDSASWVAKYPNYTPSTKNEDNQTIFGDFHRYIQFEDGNADIGNRRYGKYTLNNFSGADDEIDYVIYRYAGMLLLKAEVELQLGNLQEAVDIVNRIRSARDLPRISLTDFQTSDELEDAILTERQFELCAEGKRWWDLIRTGKAVEVMGPINGQTNQTLLFPIFFEHLVDNPRLSQTLGY